MPRGARFQWPEIQRADRARPRQQSGLASFVAVVNLCSRVGKSQRKRQELGQLREKCAPTSTAMRYRVVYGDPPDAPAVTRDWPVTSLTLCSVEKVPAFLLALMPHQQ